VAIILGIDPGSHNTGYGVINCCGNKLQHVASGVLRVKNDSFAIRLKEIFLGVSTIIDSFHPTEAAVEQVFVHINVNSALKLGQARGAALVALAQHELDIAEYLPRQIKQAVVGYGASDKNQVQQMVKFLLKLKTLPTSDAADALAVAICHANRRRIRR